MAKDADDNYYYDEGTIAEQFEDWDVYQDSDGNVGFYDGSGEIRLHNLGFVLGGARDDPTDAELGEDEGMLYVSAGNDTGATGDLLYAYNDGSSVTVVIVGDLA